MDHLVDKIVDSVLDNLTVYVFSGYEHISIFRTFSAADEYAVQESGFSTFEIYEMKLDQPDHKIQMVDSSYIGKPVQNYGRYGCRTYLFDREDVGKPVDIVLDTKFYQSLEKLMNQMELQAVRDRTISMNEVEEIFSRYLTAKNLFSPLDDRDNDPVGDGGRSDHSIRRYIIPDQYLLELINIYSARENYLDSDRKMLFSSYLSFFNLQYLGRLEYCGSNKCYLHESK